MIQDNASFTFLHRIADVDRGKIRHLSKVLLGDVSLVAELLKPQRKDVCVELHGMYTFSKTCSASESDTKTYMAIYCFS